MDRTFKIHASQAFKIMGRIGLTDIQLARMDELQARNSSPLAKPLTDKMQVELKELQDKFSKPELPQTAKTHLHEWYADDKEEIFSVYTQKGNYVESDLIDYMAEQLGFGMAEKNLETKEDDYFIGTCDVELPKLIVDVKAPWNRKTLHDSTLQYSEGYELQAQVYMHLWNKDEFLLFYGLMDTPEDINYGKEVTYADMPHNERWVAYKFKREPDVIKELEQRVVMCREYLLKHDLTIKSKLGKIHS